MRRHAICRAAAAAACAILPYLSGCRDAPAPFDAGEGVVDTAGPPWRLTYSPNDDRAPAWSPAGDSVYYTAGRHEAVPRSRGVLVGIPRAGGVARPILSEIQTSSGIQRWLAAAAVARTGDRVAYTEMWFVSPLELCPPPPSASFSCNRPEVVRPEPRLGAVMLRVREFDGAGPIDGDPALRVEFDRIIFDTSERPFGLGGIYRVQYHPFQILFGASDDFIFRPSWAPDGRRLAFSDGLRIFLWIPGAGGPLPLPGTEDGVWPAWSPDGQWLAFNRLVRADSIKGRCVCVTLGPVNVQERTVYGLGPSVLTLVRPDGTGLTELGEGHESAWAPDGRSIFFRRGDEIWRIDVDGRGASAVPGTEGGREPSVSPDGRLLTFARLTAAGDHDIWVVSLEPPR